MMPGAIFVNVSRGGVVRQPDLIDALESGHLKGAVLDVFEKEPLPADNPLWGMGNVIVTPHTSGAMRDYWTPLVALFADNLRRFEKGQPLLNVVDKVAGY